MTTTIERFSTTTHDAFAAPVRTERELKVLASMPQFAMHKHLCAAPSTHSERISAHAGGNSSYPRFALCCFCRPRKTKTATHKIGSRAELTKTSWKFGDDRSRLSGDNPTGYATTAKDQMVYIHGDPAQVAGNRCVRIPLTRLETSMHLIERIEPLAPLRSALQEGANKDELRPWRPADHDVQHHADGCFRIVSGPPPHSIAPLRSCRLESLPLPIFVASGDRCCVPRRPGSQPRTMLARDKAASVKTSWKMGNGAHVD